MAAAFRFLDREKAEGWVPKSPVEIAAELPLLPGVIGAAEWPLLPGVIGDPISIVAEAIFIAITMMKRMCNSQFL